MAKRTTIAISSIDELENLVSTLEINKSEKSNYKYKGDVIDGVRIELTIKYERKINSIYSYFNDRWPHY